MNLLPKASGTRPRVACEIMPHGVVAARSTAASEPLAAVARVVLAEGAIAPSLKPGNIVDCVAVTAAVRRALEQIGERSNARGSDIALVIPDSAVRVLLLDFEALPNRLTEALPLVRFRLKKLLPFDSDDAMVTFQVMSTSKNVVRVLAVAIPRDVLREYETAVREAGFEPGAVLPSTLACLAAVDDAEPALLVNANSLGVTAAIVRGGTLLLHRSVDLQKHGDHLVMTATPLAPAELSLSPLPLVNVEETASEWAAQEPLPEHGRNPYADRVADEEAVQGFDSFTNLPPPGIYVTDSPLSSVMEEYGLAGLPDAEPLAGEIAQAVSVAAAYFEDTLGTAPTQILSAGSMGADKLSQILSASGVGEGDGLRVRELVGGADLLPDAVSSSAPRSWLSGVLGALRG
jgi:type IV pilus assembly protein PilM